MHGWGPPDLSQSIGRGSLVRGPTAPMCTCTPSGEYLSLAKKRLLVPYEKLRAQGFRYSEKREAILLRQGGVLLVAWRAMHSCRSISLRHCLQDMPFRRNVAIAWVEVHSRYHRQHLLQRRRGHTAQTDLRVSLVRHGYVLRQLLSAFPGFRGAILRVCCVLQMCVQMAHRVHICCSFQGRKLLVA